MGERCISPGHTSSPCANTAHIRTKRGLRTARTHLQLEGKHSRVHQRVRDFFWGLVTRKTQPEVLVSGQIELHASSSRRLVDQREGHGAGASHENASEAKLPLHNVYFRRTHRAAHPKLQFLRAADRNADTAVELGHHARREGYLWTAREMRNRQIQGSRTALTFSSV